MNIGVTAPERQRSMNLFDGRALAWSEWGPVDGVPALFCTGAAMSGSLAFGADALADLGLRLIAVDRPGLGRSDAHSNKTLSSWGDDAKQLIATMGLHDTLAIGFSQGTPFALALAGNDVVKAAAIVSGQDELAHACMARFLDPQVADLIRAIQKDSAGFEQTFAKVASPQALWDLIVGMSSERDRALYLSAEFKEPYQRCLSEGFAQGRHGYVRDLVNAFGPWPVAPERIAIPIDLWYGRLDTSTVHSPDFGATLASRLCNASITVYPNEGASILWTRASEILTRLKSRV